MNEKRKEVEVLRPEVQGSDNRGGNLFEGDDLPLRLFRLRTSPPAQPQRKNGSEEDLGRILGMLQDLFSTSESCITEILPLPRTRPGNFLHLWFGFSPLKARAAPGRYNPGAKKINK